jgi:transposase
MNQAMTAAAKDLDLSVLPPEYRAAFEALQVAAARVTELEEITRRQEHLIAEMHHALYGKKSEKLSDDDRQLAFEDLEVAIAEVEEKKKHAAPADDKPKRRKRAKRNRGNLPEGLPRIEQVVEPDSLECPCGCGLMHKIGEDRNERLDIVPAQLRVIVTVRPKYACRTCTDGVTQAPTPPWLIEGGLPTEGAIAHVLVSKYADHSVS